MEFKEIPWERGNCVGTDADTWFAGDSHKSYPIQERICRTCEIKDLCLGWAVENDEVGFWGGQYFRDQGRMSESNGQGQPGGLHAGDNGDQVSEVRGSTPAAMPTVERGDTGDNPMPSPLRESA